MVLLLSISRSGNFSAVFAMCCLSQQRMCLLSSNLTNNITMCQRKLTHPYQNKFGSLQRLDTDLCCSILKIDPACPWL